MDINWGESTRVFLGISFVGAGIVVAVNSQGRTLHLIFGFILGALGLAIMVSK